MRVHVVSLERSTSRRESMRAQLDALGVDYRFSRAVDGRAGEHLAFTNYSEDRCLKNWRRPLTEGEVGCFASHFSLWMRCVEDNRPMVVMEDDVEVGPALLDALQLLPALAGVGYVRLAGVARRSSVQLPIKLPGEWQLVRFLKGPMGTQCYFVTPAAAKRFIAGAGEWTEPVDEFMDRFWQHGVSCVGLVPFPISIPTTIASTISPEGQSPSALMRRQVWRPKRFLARQASSVMREWANLEYAAGMRKVEADVPS